ncbi:hypothetical protein IP939_16930, partial [Leptospira borgpetersenii serovar Ballum]|nr:hypothetical protein [Leptospira borgpetersenii serovar Ballum]
QVLTATPIKETIKTPRQECRNVTVTHRKPVQDENQIAGSVLGAVAGGVVGQQVQSMMNRNSGVELEVRRDNGTTFLVVQAQGVTQFQPGQRVTIATHGNTVTITPR